MNRIFVITEMVACDWNWGHCVGRRPEVFEIDEDLWIEELARGDESDRIWDMRYVSHIMEDLGAGRSINHTSLKYSFSDTPDWFEFLRPRDREGKTVVHVTYNVGN